MMEGQRKELPRSTIKPSMKDTDAIENKDLPFQVPVQRRPLTTTSFVDNNQIIEVVAL
jgi:hypothetical protein